MDVNGTRFHLLLGTRDWRNRINESTVVADRAFWDSSSLQVTLSPELFRFPERPSEGPFTPADRRGSARDRFGHFYWISGDRRSVRYRPRDDSASAEFWRVDQLVLPACPPNQSPGLFVECAAPPLPTLPLLSGLAVTERHFLIVGTLQPAGLLVFDLHGGGPPVWQLWPETVPFTPFDMAATPDGGAWVLDRPDGGGLARLWRLDSALRLVRATGEVDVPPPQAPEAFQPVDPLPPSECVPPSRRFPTGIALSMASPPVPAFGDVLAVVSLQDGTALVAEVDAPAGDTRIYRWTLECWQSGSPSVIDADQLGTTASLSDALSILLNTPTPMVAHDITYVPKGPPDAGILKGTLFAGDIAGNQSFAFGLSTGIRGTTEAGSLDISAQARYFPMRRWAGKALISGADQEAHYDLADNWLPLTELPRPRYARLGVVDRLIFDGKEPGCVWHRLMLDACIPPGDLVEVRSRNSDDKDELSDAPWRSEPPLRLRPCGSELPWMPELQPPHAKAPGVGTWELLFQEAAGRWIEIELTLRGSGRSSPKIRALRAYYPRFSYTQYLPAVYREDASSASFVERFLANFEGMLTELEGRVATAEVLFDHATAPASALDWLAGWLGAVLDPEWDESRRRLFIDNAVEMYRRRGTRRGLLAAVRVALEKCPDASGLFADDRDGGPFGFRISEAFAQGDEERAHRFTVLAPAQLSSTPVDRIRLRDSVKALVERERPAHTAFDVQLYWALFRVGSARVGFDTALGEGSRFTSLVLGAGYLGQSLLGERHPWDVDDRRVVARDREGFGPPLG